MQVSIEKKETSTGSEDLKQYSSLTRKLLNNRGVFTDREAQIFLSPNYERDTHDPFLLKDMSIAVDRILNALDTKEKIVIFSDFDADGIPAAVILSDFFKKIEYTDFSVSIPHRNTEGFGLNAQAIERFIAQGVTLLITLDCGMGDSVHIKKAQDAGIDVIIVDHHLPAHGNPQACAIVNPNQEGDTYPYKCLCGAGVTYKLVQALIRRIREVNPALSAKILPGWEKWLLDMVGIATLSDMVALTGENRVLAYYGLLVLRKSRRVGLKTMFQLCRIRQRYLTEDDVVFMITPRINAASRMDAPEIAFKLLSSQDEAEAQMLAEHLTKINNERKGLVAAMTKEAKQKIDESHSVIVVGNPHWQPGLLGLVANYVVETYQKPAFVWGRGAAATIKGSCRSDGSVDLVTLMTGAADVFVEYGGHTHSGGFSLSVENIEHLSSRLNAVCAEKKETSTGGEISFSKVIDGELSLDTVSWDTYRDIEALAPFGMDNHKPTFFFKDIPVRQSSRFGKEKQHVRLLLATPTGGFISGIKFFVTQHDPLSSLVPGDVITLTATLEKSTFGKTELRLRIGDIVDNKRYGK